VTATRVAAVLHVREVDRPSDGRPRGAGAIGIATEHLWAHPNLEMSTENRHGRPEVGLPMQRGADPLEDSTDFVSGGGVRAVAAGHTLQKRLQATRQLGRGHRIRRHIEAVGHGRCPLEGGKEDRAQRPKLRQSALLPSLEGLGRFSTAPLESVQRPDRLLDLAAISRPSPSDAQ